MSLYSYLVGNTHLVTPVLKKGWISLYPEVNMYFYFGQDPVATNKCALLKANEQRRIRLPVKCTKLSLLAVSNPGVITITEENEGVTASCSAQ
jgi:hypothetical protein